MLYLLWWSISIGLCAIIGIERIQSIPIDRANTLINDGLNTSAFSVRL